MRYEYANVRIQGRAIFRISDAEIIDFWEQVFVRGHEHIFYSFQKEKHMETLISLTTKLGSKKFRKVENIKNERKIQSFWY